MSASDLLKEAVQSTAAAAPGQINPADKRCSDFDEDCAAVRDPLSCWMGGAHICNGEIVETPVADGYCPLLRK